MNAFPGPRALIRGLTCWLTVAATLGCALACTPAYLGRPGSAWATGNTSHTIVAAGRDRTFLLHVPLHPPRTRFATASAYPLIVLLHGSGADAEVVREQSQIEPVADSEHVVIAYPNGTTGFLGFGSDWNAGQCCGAAASANVDDVGFLRAVIGDVAAHVPIDRRRIYVAGFSDGGRMAYRMGCDAAAVVASIGVVSGSLARDHCAPSRPVPVIAFHGTDDSEISYDDGASTQPPTPPPPGAAGLPSSIRFWSVIDGCTGVVIRQLSTRVSRAAFRPCRGAPVVLYTVDGGLHAWPGSPVTPPDSRDRFRELDATSTMVRFFLRQHLR